MIEAIRLLGVGFTTGHENGDMVGPRVAPIQDRICVKRIGVQSPLAQQPIAVCPRQDLARGGDQRRMVKQIFANNVIGVSRDNDCWHTHTIAVKIEMEILRRTVTWGDSWWRRYVIVNTAMLVIHD